MPSKPNSAKIPSPMTPKITTNYTKCASSNGLSSQAPTSKYNLMPRTRPSYRLVTRSNSLTPPSSTCSSIKALKHTPTACNKATPESWPRHSQTSKKFSMPQILPPAPDSSNPSASIASVSPPYANTWPSTLAQAPKASKSGSNALVNGAKSSKLSCTMKASLATCSTSP